LGTNIRQSSKLNNKNSQWSNSTYNDAWDNVDLDALNPEEDQTVKEIDHISKESAPPSSRAQTNSLVDGEKEFEESKGSSESDVGSLINKF